MNTLPRSYSAFCACAWAPTSRSTRDSLSSIHHSWPRLIMLCASALTVLLWSGSVVRAGAFDDQTASLFPDSDPIGGGFRGGPTSWGDYNNDGYVDISFSGSSTSVWKNNGGTSFSWGGWLNSTGPHVWGDYNNDGLLDVYSPADNILLRNQSSGSSTSFDKPITMPTRPAQIPNSRGASWADYNGDGYLDLYVAGFSSPNNTGLVSTLMINNSGTSFSGSTIAPVTSSVGVTSCDWDSDGDQDFYVSNYHLQANGLWRNNGSASFTNVAGTHNATGGSGHSIGSAWGDIDNDGDFDLFVGNFSHSGQPQSRFLENRGPSADHAFQDNGTGGVAWQESFSTPTLGDYDNDGDLDLFFTTAYSGDNPVLYRNDDNWNFTNVTAAEGLSGLGPTVQATWADIDNDGDLDLATAGKIFVNNVTDPTEGNSNHWLRVQLRGDGATVNGAAIGSQVRITVGGKTLTRQIEGGTGEGNQNDLTLHFGLGDHSGPVDLVISAPDGTTKTVSGVAVDQTVDYVVSSRPASELPTLEMFKTGFETSEGYATGNLHGQQGWKSVDFGGTTSTTVHKISTGDSLGGTQALQIDHDGTWVNWLAVSHAVTAKSTGVVTVEFWMRLEDSGGTSVDDTQGLVARTGNEGGTGSGWGKEYFMIPAHYDTEITTYSPDYYVHLVDAGTDSVTTHHYMAGITDEDEWKGIRIVQDLDADTFSLYGRSESDTAWTAMSPAGGNKQYLSDIISSIHFYSVGPFSTTGGYQGTKDVYIDDILVTWAGPGIFGDANGDWLVDSADLAIWQQYYDPLGLNDNTFAMGDWNGDGFIDSADLALWQQYYDPVGHTPEPGTLALLAVGALAVICRRRRRSISR